LIPANSHRAQLTAEAPGRSVEKSQKNERQAVPGNGNNWRIATVAMVTVLALLIVPFCGSLCAASRGCSASVAIQAPAGGDCHHGAAAAGANGSQAGFFAATICNSSELPVATVSSSKSWDKLHETRGTTARLHSVAARHRFPSSPCTRGARSRESYILPGTSDRVTQTTVLRI